MFLKIKVYHLNSKFKFRDCLFPKYLISVAQFVLLPLSELLRITLLNFLVGKAFAYSSILSEQKNIFATRILKSG